MYKYALISLLGLVVALLLYPRMTVRLEEENNSMLVDTILLGLRTQVNSTKPIKHRVAIGYNSNLDLIVKANDLFTALGISTPPTVFVDHPQVSTLKEFQDVFFYYLRTGSAVERFVASSEVFEQIIAAAISLPNKLYHVGGNAGLMANRMAVEGCDVLLGGHVGKTLGDLLHPSVVLPSELLKGATKETKYDGITDEVHLIMEYEKGAKWGDIITPRANRYIVARDETNSGIATLSPFHESLQVFQATLVIISGLHLMEAREEDYRKKRLREVIDLIEKIPHHKHHKDEEEDIVPQGSWRHAPVHLELASIGSSIFMSELGTTIVPVVDSLGLNEQELGSLYLSLGGQQFTALDFSSPKISTVVSSLQYIISKTIPDDKSSRQLSRIHFHCLTFHLIVQRVSSGWTSGAPSVAAGSLACSKQACSFNDIELLLPLGDVELSKLNGGKMQINLSSKNAVTQWVDDKWEYSLAPVLVCKKPGKTVGLGDAISSVALMYQQMI
eukprot:TRINITY_DN5932_c0_g1_i4.p1 TRINITY_DN5932_c0_g1~~TRINITY_DN5932_c0_g1_i4.p1  ORF type:complete len:501 (+),score=67.22 TRINITY_DN5932_c0_g1_i4:216-1718(+)